MSCNMLDRQGMFHLQLHVLLYIGDKLLGLCKLCKKLGIELL